MAQIYLLKIFAVFKCKIDEPIFSDPGLLNLKTKKKNPSNGTFFFLILMKECLRKFKCTYVYSNIAQFHVFFWPPSQIFFTEKKNQKDSVDFWCRKFLQTLRRLFIILVGLTMAWFNEKILIFNVCRRGLMPNLIKKF